MGITETLVLHDPSLEEIVQAYSPFDLETYAEGNKLKISREQDIPLDQIDTSGLLVDENHARDLAEAMNSQWGQTQTVLLRARIQDGVVVYDILDGMHRVSGREKAWKHQASDDNSHIPTIRSVVMYNCTDAEMYEQRMLAANSAKAVKYARTGTWMKGAWDQTPWKDRITVAEAFCITRDDSSGKYQSLTPDEVDEIKRWTRTQAARMLTTVGTVFEILRVIEVADPELVSRVRGGAFGKGQLAITPPQLEAIALAFPRNYEIQNIIATYATGHSLSTEKIKRLVSQLLIINDQSPEFIRDILTNGISEIDLPTKAQNPATPRKRRKRKSYGEMDEIITTLEAQLQTKEDAIRQLETQVAKLQDAEWWAAIPNLSNMERRVLELVFQERCSIEETAEQLKILDMRVIQLLASTMARYSIMKADARTASQVVYKHTNS